MSYKLKKLHTLYNYNEGNTGRKYIVIHYTGNGTDTAKNNAKYFYNTYRGSSAHYFVDSKKVYEVVSPDNSAWSVGENYGSNNLFGICTNGNSINIEMCSTFSKIPQKTFDNTVELTKKLMKKYNIPTSRVVRHYDVCSKQCPGWKGWTGSDTSIWKKFKNALTSTTVRVKARTNLYAKPYKDIVGGKSKPVVTIAKGTKVQWLSDDDYGWSAVRYNGKKYYIPNSRLSKSGLSKYKTIKVPKGKKVYKVANGKIAQTIKLTRTLKFTKICSIEGGKYKGYLVLNRKGREFYYK